MSAAGEWSRVEALLDELLDLEPPARQARLAAIASADPELARHAALNVLGVVAERSSGVVSTVT